MKGTRADNGTDGSTGPPVPPASAAKRPCSLIRKLKPGPGRSREEVAEHQRARIHAAVIELVAGRGYEALTVSEIFRTAHVSKRSFYEHFAGKEECFLATYDSIQRRTVKEVMAAYRGGGDWQERLRLALSAFARATERDPRAALLCHVEAYAAGPGALERIQHAAGLFAAVIKESFDHAPDGVEVPPLLVRAIVSGLACVARWRLLEGREAELPGAVPELMEWMLTFRSEAAAELAALGESCAVIAPVEPSLSHAARPEGEHGAGALERELILDATTRLAADQGYAQLSVPRIRAAAGVSRRSFDANFTGAQDCFLDALELLTERTIALAEREGEGRNWPGGIHRAFSALCAHAVRDPALARLAFVEVFAPGSRGIRHRDLLTGAIAQRLRDGAPPDRRPSALAANASIGAAWGVVHHHVVSGRVPRLAHLAPMLSFLVLAPALGAPQAAQAIRAEQALIDTEARAAAAIPAS